MNHFYLTPSNEYIEASYAPTGRASCKSCKSKIEKDSIRIGDILDDDHFNAKNWYHLDCYKIKPSFRHIDPLTQIHNLKELNKQDQGAVLKHFKSELKKHGKSVKEVRKTS